MEPAAREIGRFRLEHWRVPIADLHTFRTAIPEATAVANYAFDVTPAELVSRLVTERGSCPATAEGLLSLYPERRSSL